MRSPTKYIVLYKYQALVDSLSIHQKQSVTDHMHAS